MDREKIKKLVENCEAIRGRLIHSPIWGLIQAEPSIIQWLTSIEDARTEIDKPVGVS